MQYKGANCTPLRDLQFALGVAPGLRPLLAKVPAAGSNTILLSHGFNLRAISGFGPAEEKPWCTNQMQKADSIWWLEFWWQIGAHWRSEWIDDGTH